MFHPSRPGAPQLTPSPGAPPERGLHVTRKRAAPALVGSLLAALGLTACSGGGTTVHGVGPSSSAPSSSVPSSIPPAERSAVYSFGVVGSSGKLLQLEHRTPRLVAGITGVVVQIATTNSDSYALTSTGTVWAWGAGGHGELGNGTGVDFVRTAVKVDFPAGVKIKSLPNPMPYDAGLAIDSSGDVWGWGFNVAHDLCLPTSQALLRPTRLPLTDVTHATGAGLHTLFDSKGDIYGCGAGTSGELGDGSSRSSATPIAVVGLPKNAPVRSLVSSWQGSGALMVNGSYYDWGFNREGQLGDGTTTDSSIPVRVRLPAAVTQVSQGGSLQKNGQTLAILAGGPVWVWGDGQWGQLGNGSTEDSSVPIHLKLPAGVTFARVSSGGYSCYAIDTSGMLWAWGRNEFGQLGNASRALAQLTPVSVGIVLTHVASTATNVAGYRTG